MVILKYNKQRSDLYGVFLNYLLKNSVTLRTWMFNTPFASFYDFSTDLF